MKTHEKGYEGGLGGVLLEDGVFGWLGKGVRIVGSMSGTAIIVVRSIDSRTARPLPNMRLLKIPDRTPANCPSMHSQHPKKLP